MFKDQATPADWAEFQFSTYDEIGAIFFKFSEPQDIGFLGVTLGGSGGSFEVGLVSNAGANGCIYPIYAGELDSIPSACWGLGAGPYHGRPADQIEVRVRSLSSGPGSLTVGNIEYGPVSAPGLGDPSFSGRPGGSLAKEGVAGPERMQRPLFINGFMATGKSSVAARVAARAGHEFVDLDRRIEARAGRSVAQIFKSDGEAEFRRLERAEFLRLLDEPANPARVVALGGGTLVPRDLRLCALDTGVVVTLEASGAEILRRGGSTPARPVLSGPDPERRAAELLDLRQRAYAEAHARVPTDGKSLDAVAGQVLRIWQQDGLAVAAGESSYAVEIGSGLVERRLAEVVGTPSRVILVSDDTVFGLHGARVLDALGKELDPVIVKLAPGEEQKHIGSVERIWRAALEAGADRSSLIVALGGGVVSDMAGFAAASYMRGVRWICVPTTLLAMVDASVGGKTAVDLGAAKNAVGAFWQPKHVLCDVDLLRTESERGFRSALAEVVKTALIGDAGLLELLERDPARVAERTPELLAEIVRRSIRVKARIVSQDERESGLRAVLNLGHTIGHALEAHAGFSRLAHGEAVSLGLVAALRLGVMLGVTEVALARRVSQLLQVLELPNDLSSEPIREAVELIGHDKKRAGTRIRFVVARDVEQVEVLDLGLDRVRELAASLDVSGAH